MVGISSRATLNPKMRRLCINPVQVTNVSRKVARSYGEVPVWWSSLIGAHPGLMNPAAVAQHQQMVLLGNQKINLIAS